MAQRESKKSRAIMEVLRAKGWFCFKVHGGAMMMAGLPDIIVCAEGIFVGLETKHDETRGDTSARQEFVHEQIRLAGGYAQVATTSAEAVDAVHRALRAAGKS